MNIANTLRRTLPERRFQPVYVEEPSVEATIAILRGLKERYEVHHGIRITDAAVAAATLSHRYIADRFLPDKAVDLMDEAASRLRMELDSMPTEIDQLERQIMQLEIEQSASRRRKTRRRGIDWRSWRESRGVEGAPTKLKAQWQNEKAAINAVSLINGQLEQAKTDLETAQRANDLNLAVQIERRENPRSPEETRCRGKIASRHHAGQAAVEPGGHRRRHRPGGFPWTGIPVTRMLESERQKLVHMEERLQDRVVGQAKRSRPWPTRCGARAAGCRTRTAPLAHSFSSTNRRRQNRAARGAR